MIKEQQGQAQGLLRVSVPISFPIDPIADLVVAFTQAEPNVRVEIERSDGFVNLIDDGFDVALRIANLADSQLIAKKIAPMSEVFCLPSIYRRGERRYIRTKLVATIAFWIVIFDPNVIFRS